MTVVGAARLAIAGGILLGSLLLFSLTNSTRTTVWRPNYGAAETRPALETSDRAVGDQSACANSEGGLAASNAEATLRHKIDRLEQGKAYLERVGDYTAKIQKQEVVGDKLLDEHTILIKCRHKPFSLYLKWVTGDPGREVLFVQGQNHGKMIAHDGGWKARLPAFYLAPDSQLAMRDARYPITSAGLFGLMDIMVGIHQTDLRKSNFATCTVEDQGFDGRPCEMFTLNYRSASESPVYRKSITLIDREWHVPLQTRHFEWPRPGSSLMSDDLDEATLIESYTFTEVQFRAGLSDHDFDRKNPNYRFP